MALSVPRKFSEVRDIIASTSCLGKNGCVISVGLHQKNISLYNWIIFLVEKKKKCW